MAVRAHDPDLSQLREPFARRDNVLADQDMIVLFVDPVGTRKFAHFFRVNPRGTIGDGLYNEDTGSEDFSPDFDCEVVTGRFEGGWTAELRIPFSSLRYGDPPVEGVEHDGVPQLPARPALPHLDRASCRASRTASSA